ncbi:MAG: hypothetical protein LAN36_06565 [Acidobacteriia bacterium]|nr:hypothetical protein [Terriglobia bacterium]
MSWTDRFDDIHTLRMFVDVCQAGLSSALHATRVVDVLKDSHEKYGKPERFASDEYYRAAKKQAEREQIFASDQESKGFTYLYGLASIKLWSILESTIDDVALECVLSPEKCSDGKLLAGLKGPLLEFFTSSPDERAELLVRQLKQDVRSSMQKGIGRYEAILAPLGVEGAVPDAVRRVIFELAEVRNVLVHRRGFADKRFVSSCPWFGATLNNELPLKEEHFLRYELAVSCYLLEIDLRFRRRDHPPDFEPETKNDVINLRDELLKRLEGALAQ